MITLELISRKRNPIKRNALLLFLFGILILTFIGLASPMIGNTIKIILMICVACIFVVSLFIINYSYKFKKVIGSISFSATCIEIDIFQKKEVFLVDKLKAIRFRLTGYEGLNKSTIFENVMLPFTTFAYHSGINNYLYLCSDDSAKRFEFYIPDKRAWIEIRNLRKQYQIKLKTT